jgi:hypothetical protein
MIILRPSHKIRRKYNYQLTRKKITTMSHWFSKKSLVGLYALSTTNIALAQTCNINGQVFQAGQNLGENFVTRCGSAEDFPCFCNPDLEQQVECPYCGFALLGGDLLCAGDNEVVSFVDINSDDKICGCSAPKGGIPSPNCDEPVDSESTCTIDLADGTSKVFTKGESLGDFLQSRCGSEFPCFCNPSLPEQIECPYCRFPSMGGDLVCARDGESVTFRDMVGVDQSCSCQIPNTLNADAITSCNASPEAPGEVPSPPPTDPPSLPLTPTDPPADFCTLEMDSGQVITFANGESYGDYLTTRCGSSEEFPCFCNPALHNQIECPYCGFASGNGSLYCAKDQETISYADGGVTRTCSCEIPDDPFEEPIRSCSVGGPPPTNAPIVPPPTNGCTFTLPDGEIVTLEDGESFGNLIEGVCGPAEDWPAFCNTDVANTISRQSNNAEYPYCIFQNTASGDPVCARNSEMVAFKDDNDVDMTCSCLYLNAALGGAQPVCRPTNDLTPPTSVPTMAPTSPMEPKGASSGFSVSWTIGMLWSMIIAYKVMF